MKTCQDVCAEAVASRFKPHAPAFVQPMAAEVASRLPEGDDWMYEVKFDGYRALVIKNGDRVQLRSRNNKDLTGAYSTIHAAGLSLRAKSAVVDGEVVAIDGSGRPSFQALQHRSAHRGHSIVFYAFDLLYLDGESLEARPLRERRPLLQRVVKDSGLLLSEPLRGTASHVTEAVRSLGLEGVIAKRWSSRYRAGERNGAWVKLRLDMQQEFVVGGYRPGPNGVDALLVGVYEGKQLRFAGKVRAGFTPRVRREVLASLEPVHTDRCPFVDLPDSRTSHWGGGVTAEQMSEMQWVIPRQVAQIRFVEWTGEGRLRHAAFLGLRTDKASHGIVRET
jgi:bifunctional non-homologous end joining protein LigD